MYDTHLVPCNGYSICGLDFHEEMVKNKLAALNESELIWIWFDTSRVLMVS
jgi:hypothetical protein